MDLSIIIPCYNEADNIAPLRDDFFPIVRDLARTRTVEVIFVDDGSRDDTWNALITTFGDYRPQNISVCFERHAVNRGLGAAIRTGLAAAHGDVLLTTDSDATYKFSEIPALLARLSKDIDVVIASPYHPAGGIANVPGYRLILSQGSSLLYRLLVDWNIHTYTSLFRAYRRRVIEQVSFQSDGFLAGTELLVNAMLAGYRVAEYPTVLHSRVHGTSKAKLIRTIQAHLRFQAQILLRRLNHQPIPSKSSI